MSKSIYSVGGKMYTVVDTRHSQNSMYEAISIGLSYVSRYIDPDLLRKQCANWIEQLLKQNVQWFAMALKIPVCCLLRFLNNKQKYIEDIASSNIIPGFLERLALSELLKCDIRLYSTMTNETFDSAVRALTMLNRKEGNEYTNYESKIT